MLRAVKTQFSRRMLGTGGAALVLLVVASCGPAQSPGLDPAQSAELDAIFEEVWQDALARSSYLRMREGLPIEELDDIGFAGYQALAESARDWLVRLQTLSEDHLSHPEWISALALAWDLQIVMEGVRWFWHQSTLTSYSSPLPGVALVLSGRPVANQDERASYLELLGQVPGFVEQLAERVRGQAERGIYVWGPNLHPGIDLIRSHLANGGPSPFGIPEARLAALEQDTRAELVARAGEVISSHIDPALESLAQYLEGAYSEEVPEGVGAMQLPDGEQYYRFAVLSHTTLKVSPEDIHQRGLELVAEMESDMAAIRAEIGFEGSREEFHEQLRTESRYYPKDSDEVADRLMAAATSMESVLEDYFLTRPQAGYGVERLAPELEASQTYGVYRPPTPSEPTGRYNYNGSKLDERSWLNLRAVSLHELVPGHHFHIARQGENEQLPEYRRNTWHGAYTEGWGSYSSWLGLEAGVYADDPLSAYGMYVLEVFLAARLVVDPGMNLLGWPLDQGREFLREHTLESQTQIATESLRYSADMPGQALAYQMGKLKLIELRERAAERLGDAFDVRDFHEAVLELGSLPMAVLEEHIDWWIEQELAN